MGCVWVGNPAFFVSRCDQGMLRFAHSAPG
jgi:hypothetical protein